MGIHADQLAIAVTLGHQFADRRFLVFADIDQDQIFAGGNVVVKSLELVVFGGDAGEAALPGTEQGSRTDQD